MGNSRMHCTSSPLPLLPFTSLHRIRIPLTHTLPAPCSSLSVIMSINVVVKWNKQTFNCELDPSLGPEIFKSQIYSLTGVPVERQKLMAKGAWSGTLSNTGNCYI